MELPCEALPHLNGDRGGVGGGIDRRQGEEVGGEEGGKTMVDL